MFSNEISYQVVKFFSKDFSFGEDPTDSSEIESNSQKYAIFGLGNIGSQYTNTRHNVGFLAVENLTSKFDLPKDTNNFNNNNIAFSKQNCKYIKIFQEDFIPPKELKKKNENLQNEQTNDQNHQMPENNQLNEAIKDIQNIITEEETKPKSALIYIVQPQTFMNLSGRAVRDFVKEFRISRKNILIIVDDFKLDYGRIKLKKNGSGGGQNGLADVLKIFNTEKIPRLRIGIGPVKAGKQAEFVLGNFNNQEKQQLPSILDLTSDCIISWIKNGLDKTMSKYNTWSTETE